MRRLLVGACSAFVVAACSSNNTPSATGRTGTHNTSAPKTVTSAPAASASCSVPFQTSTLFVRSDGSEQTSAVRAPSTPMRLLRDIRVTHLDAAGGSFDRVVFAFDAGTPGYEVGYVERPIHADPSDAELKVKGDALLRVRMEAASGVDLSGSQPRTVYNGPARIDGPGAPVAELVRSGDFEAVLTWVIGVDRKTGFKVYPLNDNSLIVDVHC